MRVDVGIDPYKYGTDLHRCIRFYGCVPPGGQGRPPLRVHTVLHWCAWICNIVPRGRGKPRPYVTTNWGKYCKKGRSIRSFPYPAQSRASAHGKTVHPSLNTHYTRYPYSQLGNGCLAAHKVGCLVLLDSSPDTVHRSSLRKTGSSTPLIWVRRYRTYPRSGIGPRCSGLRVTGHRYLPGWYSLAMSRSPWGFKFSRACSLRNRPARRWWRLFLPSPDRRPALPPDP